MAEGGEKKVFKIRTNTPTPPPLPTKKPVTKTINTKTNKLTTTKKASKQKQKSFFLPGVSRVSITGQHFTMEINLVVVVEEPKRSDLELLETSVGIVAVIQCCISWASVGVLFSWF